MEENVTITSDQNAEYVTMERSNTENATKPNEASDANVQERLPKQTTPQTETQEEKEERIALVEYEAEEEEERLAGIKRKEER